MQAGGKECVGAPSQLRCPGWSYRRAEREEPLSYSGSLRRLRRVEVYLPERRDLVTRLVELVAGIRLDPESCPVICFEERHERVDCALVGPSIQSRACRLEGS